MAILCHLHDRAGNLQDRIGHVLRLRWACFLGLERDGALLRSEVSSEISSWAHPVMVLSLFANLVQV